MSDTIATLLTREAAIVTDRTLHEMLLAAPEMPASHICAWASRQIAAALNAGEFDALPDDTRQMLSTVSLVTLAAGHACEDEPTPRRRTTWLRRFGF